MDPSPRAIAEMFDSVSLGAPENAVGFVMWRVTHRFQREVEKALRHLDVTHLQFTTLALVGWMGREGGSATQAELARFGDIHPMQVSNVLKALEGKGLIRRSPAARRPAAESVDATTKSVNAMAKSVTITAAGLETLRAALPLTREVQRKLFGDAGLPGGWLLEALLRIDRGAAEA